MCVCWRKHLFFALGLLVSGTGYAQQQDEQQLPPLESVQWEEDEDGQTDEPLQQDDSGFRWSVLVGAAPSWTVNQNRLEVEDGHYTNLGGTFELGLGYVTDPHEWFADFSVFESFMRVPSLPGFVNSEDTWSFSTIYRYRFLRWMGLFDRIRLRSVLFPTTDTRSGQVTYTITHVGDNFIETIEDSQLKLTTPFLPLRLQESAGLFFQPWQQEEFAWELRTAFGAWLTFATDQRVVDAVDNESNEVKIDELANFYHLGPEVGTSVGGHVFHNVVSYRAGLDFMIPLLRYGREKIQGSAWKLINVNSYASLSLHPIRWLAFTWNLTAIREAAIRPDFQLHNYIMIAVTYANKSRDKRLH